MNTAMPMPAILSQQTAPDNNLSKEKPRQTSNKSRTSANPFIRAGNVTGIALEFFVRQMASRYITRTAADFLTKICNVAAASEAYQLYYSKTTMAEKAGVCTKSVQRYMRVIEASGIMTRTTVTDSVKGHQPNVYTFSPSFIAAARSFFTEKLSAGQIKGLRAMAQSELSSLVDKALAPFKRTLRQVLSLDAAKAFFNGTPIGQIDPSSPGQSDPQEVEVTQQETADINPTRQGEVINSPLNSTITGKERKAMTNAALIETRQKRERESAQVARANRPRRNTRQDHARKILALPDNYGSDAELRAMGWNTSTDYAAPAPLTVAASTQPDNPDTPDTARKPIKRGTIAKLGDLLTGKYR